jgi:hypothetical protein
VAAIPAVFSATNVNAAAALAGFMAAAAAAAAEAASSNMADLGFGVIESG